MKEHKHKKHRRSSHDRDLIDLPRKVPKREPHSPLDEDQDRPQIHDRNHKKHHHHHHHDHVRQHHPSKESSKNSERGREERDRDREKRRETDYDRGSRKHSDHTKIKEEPVGSDDNRDRVEPSSSRWDEEEDQGHHRSRGSGRDSGAYKAGDQHSGGQGGFRQGGRGDRGGGRGGGRGRGRGGFHGSKRHFPKEEEDTSNMEWGKKTDNGDKKQLPPEERDKPNFGLSGKLTEDTNTYKGVVIKYSEPPEARVPKRRWRLYPFKGEEELKVLHLHRASAFLMGRERKVVDIPLDHPSCSKQHAAIQFRLVNYSRADGSAGKRIRPYLIDLDSANGSFVNNNKIEPRKYVELLERDVLKFGYSSREYVLLHEHSKDDDADDM